jgi:hypothetical protein
MILSHGPAPSPAAIVVAREAAAPGPKGVFKKPEAPRKPRPPSVLIALVAGGLAVFMDLLATIAIAGGRANFWQVVYHSWILFAVVWIGLLCGARFAWRLTRIGAILAAFLLCNSTLKYQVEVWRSDSSAGEIGWGVLRMLLPSVPLLVVFLALGARSAREYYKMVCPSCGSAGTASSARFFTRVRCRNCDHEW